MKQIEGLEFGDGWSNVPTLPKIEQDKKEGIFSNPAKALRNGFEAVKKFPGVKAMAEIVSFKGLTGTLKELRENE
jgi:hypothetical protein